MSLLLDKSQIDERTQRIEAVGFCYASQPKKHLDACNLCGNAQFVVLTHTDRYYFPVKAMACLQCGLVFLNPVMTAEAYKEFYIDIYRPLVSAFHGRTIDAKSVQDEQLTYAQHLGDFLEPFLSASSFNGTMLDIGGSTGVIAFHLANRFGFQPTILDPAPPEIEQAKALGLQTITGILEDFDTANRQYDCIILCQTADHLLDVTGSLQKIKQLLAKEGLFFVDIVDFRAACLRTRWVNEVIKVDHPYYFTEPTIESYLARVGFEVVRKNYSPDPWHIGYLCRHSDLKPADLPNPASLTHLLREIRQIQNPPKPGRG